MSISIGGYTRGYGYSDYTHIQNLLGIFYNASHLNRLLEHDGPRRGDVSITLTSPQGTQSTLLPYRNRDFINTEGLTSWPFMSVLHWGEDPRGIWNLSISFQSSSGYVELKDVNVIIYGTASVPEAIKNIPTQCDTRCAGGCAAEGVKYCDACKNLRNSITLECIDICPNGFEVYKGHCVDPSINLTYAYVQPSIPYPRIQQTALNSKLPTLQQSLSTLLPSEPANLHKATQVLSPTRVYLGGLGTETVSTFRPVSIHHTTTSSGTVSPSPVQHDERTTAVHTPSDMLLSPHNHASQLPNWSLLSMVLCILVCYLVYNSAF